jgi:hypothetical protein
MHGVIVQYRQISTNSCILPVLTGMVKEKKDRKGEKLTLIYFQQIEPSGSHSLSQLFSCVKK